MSVGVDHDRWERPALWLALATIAVAVVLYAWVTSQRMLVEFTQQTSQPLVEIVELSGAHPTESVLGHED
ncbi:MAG: hypothetical protein IT305_10135 [Chloroflexi bacterium]|nr:hypothetical protein [Chloroflexota bacterium]